MSRCVSDYTLWLLSEGEASAEARAHVLVCETCSARYRRLTGDLDLLRAALMAPPPVPPGQRRPQAARMGWMAAAAALAALLVVVWSGGWWLGPSLTRLPPEGGPEPAWSLLADVSALLFATADVEALGDLNRPSDLADLQAALSGQWPCEPQEFLASAACGEQPWLLLAGD